MALSPQVTGDARGHGARARIAIAARVLLAISLCVVAVGLVTWLSERRGLRFRLDLTSSAQNTLDPASESVLDKLPADVSVDVFFSAPEPPYHQVGPLAQERMRRVLRLAVDHSGGRITVVDHDLRDRSHLPAETQARMIELNQTVIEPGGLCVVACGARREIVRLRPDIADIDPGQPDPRAGPTAPARIANFRGEEALVTALLKVSQGDAHKVYFTAGHGERDLRSPDPLGALLFARELAGDGFETATWDGSKQGALPADAALVAIVGPEQLFTAAEVAELRRFVESGGRLFAAVGTRDLEGEGALPAILAPYGIRVRPRGVVGHPIPSIDGSLVTEREECGDIAVGVDGMPAQNPITESLRRAGRRVLLRASRVLERGDVPAGAGVFDLLRSPPDAWHELLDPGAARYAWRRDEGEDSGRFVLALQATLPPARPVPESRRPSGVRPECRIVAVGSPDLVLNYLFPSNRDFVMNSFNWLADRNYRVRVSSANRETRRMDMGDSAAVTRVFLVSVVLLPLAALACGFGVAWKRRQR